MVLSNTGELLFRIRMLSLGGTVGKVVILELKGLVKCRKKNRPKDLNLKSWGRLRAKTQEKFKLVRHTDNSLEILLNSGIY